MKLKLKKRLVLVVFIMVGMKIMVIGEEETPPKIYNGISQYQYLDPPTPKKDSDKSKGPSNNNDSGSSSTTESEPHNYTEEDLNAMENLLDKAEKITYECDLIIKAANDEIKKSQNSINEKADIGNSELKGDPVRVTTGEFYHNEKDFCFDRIYASNSTGYQSLGPGWFTLIDSRIIRGTSIDAATNYLILKNFYDSLINISQRANLYTKRTPESKGIYNQIQINIIAVEKRMEKVEAEAYLAKKLLETNTLSNFIGMSNEYEKTGNGNLTVITENGLPQLFIERSTGLWEASNLGESRYHYIKSANGKDAEHADSFIRYSRSGSEYQYNKTGLLISWKIINDENEYESHFIKRNENTGEVTKIINPYNTEFQFTNKGNRVTSITDQLGQKISYTYTNGLLTSVTDEEGDSNSYVYINDKLTKVIKPDATFIEIVYGLKDANGKLYVTEVIDEEKATEQFAYQLSKRETTWTTANGKKSKISWNDKHCTVKEEKNDGSWCITELNPLTNDIISEKRIQGTTFYKYDSRGNKTETIYSDASTEVWEYDSKDRLILHKDRDDVLLRFEFDETGIVRIIKKNTYVKEITRDSRGLISKIKELGYEPVEITRDIKGRIIETRQTNGIDIIKKRYTYDLIGRIKSWTNANNETTFYEYGNHSKTEKTPSGLITTKTWNNRKDIISITEIDALSSKEHKTHIMYDKRHLPLRIENNDILIAEFTWTKDRNLELTTKGKWIEKRLYNNNGLLSSIEKLKKGSYQSYLEKFNQIQSKEGISYSITRTLGGGEKVITNDNGLPTVLNKKGGPTLKKNWSAQGRLLSEQAEQGGWYINTYNTEGYLIESGRKNSKKEEYTWNENGKIESIKKTDDTLISFIYDSLGRCVSENSKDGTIKNSYDKENKLISRTYFDSDKKVIDELKYIYDKTINTITEIRGNKYITTYVFDAWDNCIEKKDGENRTQFWEYNNLSQCISDIDGYGNKTNYEWNEIGLISKIMYPNNSFITFEYDAAGNTLFIRDSTGIISERTYDAEGNIESEKERGGILYTYKRNIEGKIVGLYEGIKKEKSVAYSFNQEENIYTMTDAKGLEFSQKTSQYGEIISETNRMGKTRLYARDSDGKLVKDSGFTDFGKNRTFLYDKLHQKIEYQNDGSELITSDFFGNILTAKNKDSNLYWVYDTGGKLIHQKNCLMSLDIYFTYDKSGLCTRIFGNKKDIRYRYGKNKELIEVIDVPNKIKISYTYDSCGREIQRSFGNGVTQYIQRDLSGRTILIKETLANGELSRAEAYIYNDDGMISHTVNEQGQVSRFIQDERGRLNTEEVPWVNFNKNYTDKSVRIQFSNSESLLLTNAMNSMSPGRGSLLSNIQIVARFEYTYDKNGNRESQKSPENAIKYSYDNENKLLSANDIQYLWDDEGNLLSKKSLQSELYCLYNDSNRMKKATVVDHISNTQNISHFTYDSLGRRVSTQDENSTTLRTEYIGTSFDIFCICPDFSISSSSKSEENTVRYRWVEGNSRLDRTIPSNNSLTTNSPIPHNMSMMFPLMVNNDIVASTIDGETFYYGTDIRSSVRSVSDNSGYISSRFEYTAFGERKETPQNTQKSMIQTTSHPGYISKYHDSATHLLNYGYRDYEPSTARFTTSDPIRDGNNWYSYCNNNPVDYTDPDGLRQIYADDINGRAIADTPGKSISSRVTLELTRSSADGYNNDNAKLKIGSQTLQTYSGIQSEKNLKSGNQTKESQRPEQDYSKKGYPNASLPTGDDYVATRRLSGDEENSKYKNASSITSSTAQLPGYSSQGVSASYGFLIHSQSDVDVTRNTGWSLGCQVFPDSEFDRLIESLTAVGIGSGDSYKLSIKQDSCSH